MTKYELKSQQFTGPLEKLLELVEERKLEIAQISLAEVTNDFLKYVELLKESGTIPHGFLADFIVVASRLILIKSKSLLPNLPLTQEEEGEIHDLEDRLRLYKHLRPLFKTLALQWKEGDIAYARPYFLETYSGAIPGVFYPGNTLAPDAIAAALKRIAIGLERFSFETATVRETIINLEEKIKEVIGRIQEIGQTTFGAMAQAKSRAEIITIFLAILHLAREQLIFLEQEEVFSDIMVKDSRAPH